MIKEEMWIVMPDKFLSRCEYCGGEKELQSLMMEDGTAFRLVCKECGENCPFVIEGNVIGEDTPPVSPKIQKARDRLRDKILN